MVLTCLCSYIISLDFFKGKEEKESTKTREGFRGSGLAMMVEQLRGEPLAEY